AGPLVDHCVLHRTVTGHRWRGRRLGGRRRGRRGRGGWSGRRGRRGRGRWGRRRGGRRCTGAVTVDHTPAVGAHIDPSEDVRIPGEGSTHVAPLVGVVVDADPTAAGVVRPDQTGHAIHSGYRVDRRVRAARGGRAEADVVGPAHAGDRGERATAVSGPEQAGLASHPYVTRLAGDRLDADEPLRRQAVGRRREAAAAVG